MNSLGYLTSGPMRSQAIKLFSSLPTLTPYDTDIEKFKLIWGEENLPKNLHLLWACPKYLPGRQVHVKHSVNTRVMDNSYLTADCEKKDSETCITHKAVIEDYDETKKEFAVRILPNKIVSVKEYEIYRYSLPPHTCFV